VKVLLDEMLPIDVREPMPGHEGSTAGYAGLAGLPNGELIRRVVEASFDVIVTLDRGIPQQQNVRRHGIAFVLIPDNDVDLIRPYADRLLQAIDAATPGVAIRLERHAAVAASQNLAKQLHAHAERPAVKGNPWQNVDRLTKQWRQSFRVDLLDGLEDATVRTLRLAFARRHVLEHNGGVIDDDYVGQTGEGVVGRANSTQARLCRREAFAAMEELADRLEMSSARPRD
jgi:hypothetical protein